MRPLRLFFLRNYRVPLPPTIRLLFGGGAAQNSCARATHFSRVVAMVIAHLRLQGIRIFYYLDDWLLVAESQSLLQSHLQATLQLAHSLGFIVNLKKSVLTPQRMPVYLGVSLDIPRLIARPVEHRVVALQSLIQELTASPAVPALLWQRVLGHLASFVDLVPNCRLLMRPLQLHFLRFFSPLSDSQSKLIPLTQEIKVLCAAWASPVRLLEGKPFSPPPPPPPPPPHSLVLTSDGWGATLPPHRVSGTWSREESLVHINSLELTAVFLALKSLEVLVSGQSLLIRSDNTTVVSYINFQGGTHSCSLCLLAIELWEWCIQRGIHLSAAHIPGEDNLVADFLSRGKFLPSEWTLNPLIFQKICQVLVPRPDIDLFASTLNFQLPKYCARCRDPHAWKVDALSFRWSGLPLYAFPPFLILPTVLEKVAQEGADMALVAPFLPETMVPEVVISSGRTSHSSPSPEGPCLPTHVSSTSSETRESTSHTLAAFREKGKQAGLSARATEFSAEALRESTRASYDSKLECFFKWFTPILPL